MAIAMNKIEVKIEESVVKRARYNYNNYVHRRHHHEQHARTFSPLRPFHQHRACTLLFLDLDSQLLTNE